MKKGVINALLFISIGAVLACYGVRWWDIGFWIIVAAIIGLQLNT